MIYLYNSIDIYRLLHVERYYRWSITMMNSNLSPYIPNSNQITVYHLVNLLQYLLIYFHLYTFPKIYLIYFYINLYNYKYQDRRKNESEGKQTGSNRIMVG